jgi:hypothetical protein
MQRSLSLTALVIGILGFAFTFFLSQKVGYNFSSTLPALFILLGGAGAILYLVSPK